MRDKLKWLTGWSPESGWQPWQVVWLVAWRSPPYYDAPPAELPVPILTMAEYDGVSQTHPRPYV